jgi:uncharacterized phage protein gp47/JayE
MTESWIDKDVNTIRNDIIALAKAETKLTNFKSTGVLRGFIEVIARVVFFIYGTAINPLYKNASLDGATGIFLSFWGLMLGVARKQAVKAAGNFTGTAYGDGVVPEGAWIVVEGTDLRYKVTAKTAFSEDDSFAIPIEAEFAGSAFNIEAGMNIRITRIIPSFDTVVIRENWITTTGDDDETDNAYRERIKMRWRSQNLGDTKDTYRYYAESVPGVREAVIVRTPRGPGSTDVVISAVNGIPDDNLLALVEQTLDIHELMGFDVFVKAPDAVPVSILVEYSGNANEAAVQLAVENYVYSIGIGGRLSLRDLYEQFDPLALTTVEILSPDRDVQADNEGLIVATVTITKADM